VCVDVGRPFLSQPLSRTILRPRARTCGRRVSAWLRRKCARGLVACLRDNRLLHRRPPPCLSLARARNEITRKNALSLPCCRRERGRVSGVRCVRAMPIGQEVDRQGYQRSQGVRTRCGLLVCGHLCVTNERQLSISGREDVTSSNPLQLSRKL
jgi:hypothetical protein